MQWYHAPICHRRNLQVSRRPTGPKPHLMSSTSPNPNPTQKCPQIPASALSDLSNFVTKSKYTRCRKCPRGLQKILLLSPLSTDRKSADALISQNDLS
ncbi:hypothetical protein TNIN_315331 [Trichonephila inaurata madagascariensis]|uniref:Uncharacterized protein n=1 Tax=Trichonephila inaurata madagascariensis TaxID=2747483 RepID=A0A8X6IRF1_9ARAC|nr:hypothetical protein TNIN_315331 [Trichonephila inaurata madagascariensis]